MHVAVYGGSFNPPHVAHQLAVTYVLATHAVDTVWVMPTPSHAFGKALAPFHHRVEMCRLAMRHFGARVEVSTLEADLAQPSRTVDTLRAMLAQQPDRRVSLMVGADILPETPKWKGWDDIQALAHILVLGRTGYPAAGSVMLPEVSSTEVRQRLAAGQGVDHLVDRAVVEYVAAHGLYRDQG